MTDTMPEIGGYIQLEQFRLPMLHGEGLAFNCARNALAWLAGQAEIRKLAVPYYLCDTAWEACRNTALQFYRVGADLLPHELSVSPDTWIYLVNYYGQLHRDVISDYVRRFEHVIVDNTQAYFDEPVPGAYTIYSCRKFFGVPDGAFLIGETASWSDAYAALPVGSSCEHMHFLLGRYEHGANPYYPEYVQNNQRFHTAPTERMSPLTKNLLCGIDYSAVREARTRNFQFLADCLTDVNRLSLSAPEGAFAYPLWVDDGASLRSKLIANRIYVPQLWPNVLEAAAPDAPEYDLARNILPLPCDQRYGIPEMERICEVLQS